MGVKVFAAVVLLCLVGQAYAGILIKQGDSGTPVRALQHLMNYYGARLVVDGAFGPGTKGAVQSIQTQIGVSADGVVGPVTLGAMYVDVRYGSNNDAAKSAQTLLGITADGLFYSGSISSLRAYQQRVTSIAVTEVVDDPTWNALFSEATGNSVGSGGTTSGGGGSTNNGHPTSVSDLGLSLIKDFESLFLNAYIDAVGVPTIGWGHTKGVQLGQTITTAQAEAFLVQDLADAQSTIHREVDVQLSQVQYDALVSFVFNVGGGGVINTGVARALAARNYDYVPNELSRWVYGDGKVLPGLVRRRCSEGILFSRGYVDTTPESHECASYP
eukprot:CAMPEP_0114612066 /NCGR_PEP_ID=MMETSP0168-20121206/4434_1 /TAXON_ID=95228 ORGANISM="Vannella sp., Strain DIVA3 517/6/12" /NCGR_SAMPLE_ID=MMETSP0168 /ASSEMBLY_ACC=CAM_ASM_000044 /LENGTH=328 /DNA_ID=CAMNT_0001823047 /DNA_START=1 /DNA_END=987 /DNA_ORIENTATION=-